MKKQGGTPVRGIAYLCALVYFTSYLLRKNLGVMLVKVCEDLGVAESAFAIVMTGLTICYGGGQLVSGILGDKIAPAKMIVCGLSVGVLANLAVYFTSSLPLLTVAWCINGFAHSMIWAPLIKLMTAHLDDEGYSYAMMRVMWGSSGATVFLRIFCPAMLLLVSWRAIMLILAAVGAAVVIFFAATYRRLFTAPTSDPLQKPEKGTDATPTVPLPRYALPMTILIVLAIVAHGMLREGVDVWMPSFLCETFGLPAENAIFSTVILSIFSVVCFTLFDWLYRRVFHNELTCSIATFGVTAVAAAVLYFLTRFGGAMVASMLMMAVIIGCMSGINLMLVALVPKRYLKSGKVATFTGLLDAAAYAGAAISTYGFAVLFERYGWSLTILIWLFIALAGLLLTAVVLPLWRKFRREYAD